MGVVAMIYGRHVRAATVRMEYYRILCELTVDGNQRMLMVRFASHDRVNEGMGALDGQPK